MITANPGFQSPLFQQAEESVTLLHQSYVPNAGGKMLIVQPGVGASSLANLLYFEVCNQVSDGDGERVAGRQFPEIKGSFKINKMVDVK